VVVARVLSVLLAGVLAACESQVGSAVDVPDPAGRSMTERPPTENPHGVDEAPQFRAEIREIGPELRARVQSGSRPGCPVRLADLRYQRVTYIGFDAQPRIGELVVHEQYAEAVVDVFRQLFRARWPLRRMRLVDEYGGDDERSMAADNTSGYNSRPVAGTSSWSKHAYGAAIDINPVENPDLTSGSVRPVAGRPFAHVDRSPGAEVDRGVIRRGGVVVRSFTRIGWEWGGTWSTADYQHFAAPDSTFRHARSGPRT